MYKIVTEKKEYDLKYRVSAEKMVRELMKKRISILEIQNDKKKYSVLDFLIEANPILKTLSKPIK